MAPHVREQFDRMIANGQRVALQNPQLPLKTIMETMPRVKIPPLVAQVSSLAPRVRETRPPKIILAANQQISAPIQSMTPEVTNQPNTYVVDGFQAFRNLLVKDATVYNERPMLKAFVDFVESIPKACGCVRSQLNSKASDMYSKLLPTMEIDYPGVTEQLKNLVNAEKIVMKEGEIVLLEV